MVTINLLPWREQLREERKAQFFSLLLFANAAVIAFLVTIHLFFSGIIAVQNSRNQYLQEEIAKVDQKISEVKNYKEEKNKILTRMNLIYSLRDNRSALVHLLSEFVDRTPPGVYLTQLTREGSTIRLVGRTDSNTAISQLMRNLSVSVWMENPTLNKIESDEKIIPRRSDFELIVTERGNKQL